jgi:cGMP-dependent protein kinase 2
MHYIDPRPRQPSLWRWLLFGLGPAPGSEAAELHGEDLVKKAVKCDMCQDISGGPACVRACPTGAAQRVSPESFMSLVSRRR